MTVRQRALARLKLPSASSEEPCSLPSVFERDTDTAWAEFNEIEARFDESFAATRPVSYGDESEGDFARTRPAVELKLGPRRLEPGEGPVTVEGVMLMARRNNRVCPLPARWAQLYDMLPDKDRSRGTWRLSRPVSIGAWATSSAMYKRLVLREHIEWASAHGMLLAVQAFLEQLDEPQWLHFSE
jgi:hypothetical protein